MPDKSTCPRTYRFDILWPYIKIYPNNCLNQFSWKIRFQLIRCWTQLGRMHTPSVTVCMALGLVVRLQWQASKKKGDLSAVFSAFSRNQVSTAAACLQPPLAIHWLFWRQPPTCKVVELLASGGTELWKYMKTIENRWQKTSTSMIAEVDKRPGPNPSWTLHCCS